MSKPRGFSRSSASTSSVSPRPMEGWHHPRNVANGIQTMLSSASESRLVQSGVGRASTSDVPRSPQMRCALRVVARRRERTQRYGPELDSTDVLDSTRRKDLVNSSRLHERRLASGRAETTTTRSRGCPRSPPGRPVVTIACTCRAPVLDEVAFLRSRRLSGRAQRSMGVCARPLQVKERVDD